MWSGIFDDEVDLHDESGGFWGGILGCQSIVGSAQHKNATKQSLCFAIRKIIANLAAE